MAMNILKNLMVFIVKNAPGDDAYVIVDNYEIVLTCSPEFNWKNDFKTINGFQNTNFIILLNFKNK